MRLTLALLLATAHSFVPAPRPRALRRSALAAEAVSEAERLIAEAAALRAEVEAAEASFADMAVRNEARLSDEIFSELDANDDGTVDSAELKAALSRHGIDASDETIAAVIRRFDTNSDGVLQKDEMPAGGFQGFVAAVRELERAKLREGKVFTNSDPVSFKEKAKDDDRPGQQPEAEDGPFGWAKSMFDSLIKGDDDKSP